MGLRSEVRGQLLLAGPLCLSHVGQQLLQVVDSAMLGRYSSAALGGAGVAGALFFAITVLGIGLIMGIDTLIPQALGAGKPARAAALYRAGIRLAVVVGAALTALVVASVVFLDLAGAEPEVRAEAVRYLFARAPSVIPVLVAVAARSFLQAHHITRPIVLATVIGNLVNIPGNGLGIYGDRALVALGLPAIGLPELGVVGAGLSSTLVSIAMMIVLLRAARWVEHDEPGELSSGASRSILRLGAPVGLQLSAEVGVFALASSLAARLGTIPAAAHQIALTLASFSFALALGIGASTSVRVGHAIGRGDTPAARTAGLAGALLGMGLMGCFGLIFVLAPGSLAGLFSSSEAVLAAAIPLLQIAALFQLSDAIQAVMAGALRGAGDTRATLVGNVVGHYALGVPVMVALTFGLELGAPGLWWGLSAGLTATAAALTLRFFTLTGTDVAPS